jgi:hypothetical protein
MIIIVKLMLTVWFIIHARSDKNETKFYDEFVDTYADLKGQ